MALRGRRQKECVLSSEERVALDVVWGTGRGHVRRVWWRDGARRRSQGTNRARHRYTARAVHQMYRLPWQVERMFTVWKSYANRHAFDTSNAGMAQGLCSRRRFRSVTWVR